MNNFEFEQFVRNNGPDILRFCIMITGNREEGLELYQSTMLRLLEKQNRVNPVQNSKSYALSVAINLHKGKKKRFAVRAKLAPMESIEEMHEAGKEITVSGKGIGPEEKVLEDEQISIIRSLVAQLPEKYRVPIYLFYSADMKIREISKILNVPENSVKTNLRRGKQFLKEKLEAIGYDR